MNERLELKVKAKTLADEARHIRKEERKLTKRARRIREGMPKYTDNIEPYLTQINDTRERLHKERTTNVRFEARAINLVRGYIKGLDYLQIENSTKSSLTEMLDLAEMMADFLPEDTDFGIHPDDIEDWMGIVDEEVSYDDVKVVV